MPTATICIIIFFTCFIGILFLNYAAHRSDAVDDLERWTDEDKKAA